MVDFPIKFVVPVNPIPKQSYRHSKKGGYQKKPITDAEMLIGTLANKAMAGMRPQECFISVRAIFYRDSYTRCDLDNLYKLLGDSMNGIVYVDDHQVTQLRLTKAYDKKEPRTEVFVDIIA